MTIDLARPLRDQVLNLELGRSDIVEIPPAEARRAAERGARIWLSSPAQLIALVLERGSPALESISLREALALSIDRVPIHNVLLQKHGDLAGALLPQWLSGYACLFETVHDPVRARRLAVQSARPAVPLVLSFDSSDPTARLMAERIAVNTREAGIALQVASRPPGSRLTGADIHLVRVPITSLRPQQALSHLSAALGLPESNRDPFVPADALYAAERELVQGFRVIPLFHLPEIYGSSTRVKTWATAGVSRLGGWHFEDLWIDEAKP
jgi:hypothetical protein